MLRRSSRVIGGCFLLGGELACYNVLFRFRFGFGFANQKESVYVCVSVCVIF